MQSLMLKNCEESQDGHIEHHRVLLIAWPRVIAQAVSPQS